MGRRLIMKKTTIEIWDYWVCAKEKIAYCLGIIDGTLYLAESSIKIERDENE